MPTWAPSVEADVRVENAKTGRVVVVPPRKKVAIVGFASSSRDDAPWTDSAYELWGMNQAYQHFQRRPDRWFEIHQPGAREDKDAPTYLADLPALGCPVYMVSVDPAIPPSVRYPLNDVVVGLPPQYHRYFTSSAAYMIALAIHEGFEEIAVYGIDCAIGTEYAMQKPCVEAWLSLAVGRGIKVIVPQASPLFKAAFLYGYEPPREFPRVLRASESYLRQRIAEYKTQHNVLLEDLHKLEGRVEELEALLAFAEGRGRGARYPTVESE